MACVPTTGTVFGPAATVTQLVTATAGVSTRLVPQSAAVLVSGYFTTIGGVRTAVQTTITQPAATSTILIPLTTVQTSLIVTSTPISLVVASCTATSSSTTSTTTSSTTTVAPTSTTSRAVVPTTTTPSSTTPSSTSSSSIPPVTTTTSGRSTVTQVTTIPFSSSSAPSSSASLAAASNRPSSTPTGAIAGGVVGGVAVLAIGAFLIWWFGARRHKKDKDWLDQDSLWDPALGGAGAMATGKRHSSKRASNFGQGGSRHGGSGGGGMAMTEAAVAGGAWAHHEDNRRSRPADQQNNYYAALPTPPTQDSHSPGSTSTADPFAAGAGMAGVGAMGRNSNHNQHQPFYHQPRRGSDGLDDPYGGLDLGRDDSGGWGVASRMHQQPTPPQPQYGHTRGASSQHSRSPTIPRVPVPAENPLQAGPSSSQHHPTPSPPPPQASQPPTSIPYRLPSPVLHSTGPGSGLGFDPSAPMNNSPAPSHMSMPALGAVWNGGSEVSEERRSGQLRVVNESTEASGLSEERRFGGENTGDAYGGLTEGLDRHKSV